MLLPRAAWSAAGGSRWRPVRCRLVGLRPDGHAHLAPPTLEPGDCVKSNPTRSAYNKCIFDETALGPTALRLLVLRYLYLQSSLINNRSCNLFPREDFFYIFGPFLTKNPRLDTSQYVIFSQKQTPSVTLQKTIFPFSLIKKTLFFFNRLSSEDSLKRGYREKD